MTISRGGLLVALIFALARVVAAPPAEAVERDRVDLADGRMRYLEKHPMLKELELRVGTLE